MRLARLARQHEAVQFECEVEPGCAPYGVEQFLNALRAFYARMSVECLVVAYVQHGVVRSGFTLMGTASGIPALRKYPKHWLYWLAIHEGCETVLCCHNHPDLWPRVGLLNPSQEDLEVKTGWSEGFDGPWEGRKMTLRFFLYTRRGRAEF